VLDDERRQTINDIYREFMQTRLDVWRKLDDDWRELLLLLISLSAHYGPAIKGSL
jgi:hypothetical protein